MDSAILGLLGAFLLSIIGLFVFIWSLRKGLLVENPRAASAILRAARSAISTTRPWVAGQQRFQAAATEPGDSGHLPDEHEIEGPHRGRPLQRLPGLHVHRLCLHVAAVPAASRALPLRSSCTGPTGWSARPG